VDGFLILAIETATGCGSVSITRGKGNTVHLLAECTTQPDVTHSRRLLGSLQWLLQTAGVAWADLDAVAVSTGPGSFTGLRIGMAAAKAIAVAADCSLVGVPTLDALACSADPGNRLLCCVLDARKEQVYASFYRTGLTGRNVRVTDPVAADLRQLLENVDEPVLLAGPGAAVHRERVRDLRGIEFAPEHLCLPRAMYVGLLAGGMMERGDVLDPLTAAPVYVRAPEAEVNLQRKLKMRS
jgi:tRNA threonylcarbamoyladenosine biosynthesis protein TsaB